MEPLVLIFVQEAERRMLESSGYRSERPALFPGSLPSGGRSPATGSQAPSRARTAAASALRRLADVVDPGLAPRAPRRAGA